MGGDRPAAEAINSLVQAQSLNNRSNFLEVEMWPGNIDMEIENENCAETESQTYFSCVTLDRNEGPQYCLQRMTGSSWSPKTFLTWLIALSVIVFTLAVITTVFQSANESSKMGNLELYDAIDDKLDATHEVVELNTAIMTHKMAVVPRRKTAARKSSRRAESGATSKVTRSSSLRQQRSNRQRSSTAMVQPPTSSLSDITRHGWCNDEARAVVLFAEAPQAQKRFHSLEEPSLSSRSCSSAIMQPILSPAKSMRRASSPPPVTPHTSPESPLRRMASSLSFCFLPCSLSELLLNESPQSTPTPPRCCETESYIAGFKK
ncbi:hypothetical protein HPB51_000402 [Rhipicephalus microplus]|uniref:Uncharacterized protein n=1 Tax=Rhipicephalus microplus TaxID=6941 RepID=A0A9J6EE89_RHIMP|nr:hypothetical protein HPB51_000402 [Rhipicephalus microplus]